MASLTATRLGGGLYRIRAEIENRARWPTALQHAITARAVKPVLVAIDVPPAAIVSGAPKHQFFPTLAGSGRREKVEVDRPRRWRPGRDRPRGGAKGRHRDAVREVPVMRAAATIAVVAVLATSPGLALSQARSPAQSQTGPRTFPTSDAPFKTRIDVNRWHGDDELVADMERLQRACPTFLKLSSIGKSYGKRDIWMMTIQNPATGPEMNKAAMFIEANVHGNEIQGTEVSLYTIWYLMENYDRIPTIKRLVDERVFYIVPTINPDGRDFFLHGTGRITHRPRARRQRRRRQVRRG